MSDFCWYYLDGHERWHAWSYDQATAAHDLAYAPHAPSICGEVGSDAALFRVTQFSWNFLTIPSGKACAGCMAIVSPALAKLSASSQHTCMTGSRSTCPPCMNFQVDLWDAINRYVTACGGDTSDRTVSSGRMDAVVAVDTVIRQAAKGGNIR